MQTRLPAEAMKSTEVQTLGELRMRDTDTAN